MRRNDRRTMYSLALLLLAGLAFTTAFAADPNKDYRTHACWWLAYSADQFTLGLFHLDDAGGAGNLKELEAKLLADDADDDPTAGLILRDEGDKVGGKKTLDSSLMRGDATLIGNARHVENGYDHGALELPDAQSALVSPVYRELKAGSPSTVECWVSRNDGAAGTVLSYDSPLRGTSVLELRASADGTLELYVAGERQATVDAKVPAGTWTHVALTVSGPTAELINWIEHKYPATIAVRVNGSVAAKVTDGPVQRVLGSLSGVVRAGNNAKGDSGLVGRIDEVRISKEVRIFYEADHQWTDPQAKREIATAPPYLRSRDECTFVATLDGTLEPQLAAKDTLLTVHALTRPGATMAKPDPEFVRGVRGQGLLCGPQYAMPIWSAPGNVRTEGGSVEFWFQPHDWDNRKEQGYTDPMEFVPLLRVKKVGGKKGGGESFLALRVLHKRPMKGERPPDIFAGTWHHVVVTWDGNRARAYMDGKRMPDSVLAIHYDKSATGEALQEIVIEPVNPGGDYLGQRTILDEVRFYNRPLAPQEVANAHARFLPEPPLKELPFANVEPWMNIVQKKTGVTADLLSPHRDQVASVALKVLNPEGKTIGTGTIERIENGKGYVEMRDVDLTWGEHRIELAYLDAGGKPIDTQTIIRDRVKPAWLGNTLGIHPGKVLPGWAPLKVQGDTIEMLLRTVVLGGDGLPKQIIARDEPLLAAPITVTATAGGKALEWTPAAAPRVESAAADIVVTSGSAKAGKLTAKTRITTEFDGLMKVEMELAPEGEVALDSLTIDIPYRQDRATLMGYWTGGGFRGATYYGHTWGKPGDTGPVFRSNDPKRGRGPTRGSWIPYVFLGDDWRGMAWFAENDRGWTKSSENPAVEIVRSEGTVTLRLNILTEPTTLTEPRTLVFGLQPVPIKELPTDHRVRAMNVRFDFVDSFSKQSLKGEGGIFGGGMAIFPRDHDWDAAKKRAEIHKMHYGECRGYTKPYLYTDRQWPQLPPDAGEHRGPWYTSGHFRHLRDAQDCLIWNYDQWLKHEVIRAFYIDDAWLGPMRDPSVGPAYVMEDGKVQPGFEWFDYHEFTKRLRWIMHENDMEPLIWIHMTRTFFTPALAFGDIILDGEDRFQAWGSKADFMDCWPQGDLRFNNGRKWGLIPVWFNKVGADAPKQIDMPHWEYRQWRSYYGALLAHDITNVGGGPQDAEACGALSAESTFVGYWEPQNPVTPKTPGRFASLYTLPDRVVLVAVNRAKDANTTELAIDTEALFGQGVTLADVEIRDVDTYDPPKGDDVTRVQRPKGPEMDLGGDDELEDLFAETAKDVERRELEKQGVFFYDDHNFNLEDGLLKLRIRPHDYRLLVLRKK